MEDTDLYLVRTYRDSAPYHFLHVLGVEVAEPQRTYAVVLGKIVQSIQILWIIVLRGCQKSKRC